MNNASARGFTLVELLVSLAILSIALAVLFGAISASLDRTRKDRNEALAASLVQSLLARAEAGRLPDVGETSGAYVSGYRWRVALRREGNGDDAKARHAEAFVIRATVSWQDGAQPQSKTLTALRIVESPPKQP